MLKLLLFEDEKLNAERLIELIHCYNPEYQILATIDSIGAGINWLKNHPDPDLILMDIHLTDGSAFELFEKVDVKTPIIFTTAYDEYAIKAFETNSVDYLVKPIIFESLKKAFNKYFALQQQFKPDQNQIYQTFTNQNNVGFKKRFLIKKGEQFQFILTKDIRWFKFDDGLVFAFCNDGKKHIIDYSIEKLNEVLPPDQFFRINRKHILNIDSVQKISQYFNNRLKLKITPPDEKDVIVSRERTRSFKEWLDQ